MFCANCGKELTEECRFCNVCGAEIKPMPAEASETEAVSVPPAPADLPNECRAEEAASMQTKEKLTFGLGPIIFCGVLILLLSIGCGIFGGLYFAERENNSAKAAVCEELPW